MSCLPQLSTLPVMLLQSFNTWRVLKQMKQSLIFWTSSRRSFTFIDLNFLQVQMGCYPSLKEHSSFLGLHESLAFKPKILVLGLQHLSILFLSNHKFVCANNFSWIAVLEVRHCLKTINLPLSIRRSCANCNHCSLCSRVSFLVVEFSPPGASKLSESVYHICKYIWKIDNARTIVVPNWSISRYFFFIWALTMAYDLPYFSD